MWIRGWNLKFILKLKKKTSWSHSYTMWECWPLQSLPKNISGWLFQLLQTQQPAGEWHVGRTHSLQSSHLAISLIALDQHKILFPLSICWPQWSAEVSQPLLTSVISLRAVVCMEAFLSLWKGPLRACPGPHWVDGKPLTNRNRL